MKISDLVDCRWSPLFESAGDRQERNQDHSLIRQGHQKNANLSDTRLIFGEQKKL